MSGCGLSYTKPTYTSWQQIPRNNAISPKRPFLNWKKLLNEEIDHLLLEDI
ncbi:hypothetical protein [Paenibacillus larvae]|uniref:hypothetical protein n=1 Tax=Paenibacillus larvae TaxID=1464 RepID=UPI00288CBB9B|nr:hypothetical protein [Paenibacillus larvae]MDT2193662.1 hypothetical protein [Paenibacillus larvae]